MKRSIETNDSSSALDEKRTRHSLTDDANQPLRYDFCRDIEEISNNDRNEETIDCLMEKLLPLKEELYRVKSALSDKPIADWNRHTAYLNPSSTIVPHLRDNLHVELATQAWGKMYEILTQFHLVPLNHSDRWISFHLCEAPGAFISALNHYLTTQHRRQTMHWHWYAQTLNPYYEHDPSTSSMLIDDDRLIFHTIDQDHWDFGEDNSGNLINQINQNHYIRRFQSIGVDFITADGSFDMLNHPGEQEHRVYPLLKSELFVALSCLSPHGHFVMKLFTMYEPRTIQLIFVLYQTFAQISIFKPTTSKRGNSEVYVICRDFHRSRWIESFASTDLECVSTAYPSSFAKQFIECSQLFQSSQVQTIEHHLYWYGYVEENRQFRKNLHRIKQQTLDQFLHRCQIQMLASTDQYLLRPDLLSHQCHSYAATRIRIGTFNDQEMSQTENIRQMLTNGSFCSTCSGKDPICSICKILQNPSSLPPFIHLGTIKAEQPVKLDFVHGQVSSQIENSCFAHRFLLKLSREIRSCAIPWNELPIPPFSPSTSIALPAEILRRLQNFASIAHLQFLDQDGIYSLRSSVLLTRLQVSVLYTFVRLFDQAQLYVIPGKTMPYLLIRFQTGEALRLDEFESIAEQVQSSNPSTLLQFVHLYQLLDQPFVSPLIQGNNLCLQLTCITSIKQSIQS